MCVCDLLYLAYIRVYLQEQLLSDLLFMCMCEGLCQCHQYLALNNLLKAFFLWKFSFAV